jgi:hypothetical protein
MVGLLQVSLSVDDMHQQENRLGSNNGQFLNQIEPMLLHHSVFVLRISHRGYSTPIPDV